MSLEFTAAKPAGNGPAASTRSAASRSRMPMEERRSNQRSRWRSPATLVVGLTVLGALLRFWKLGEWNFQATEIFTLRDSTSPQFGNPRPLMYLLNYYVMRPLMPLDEFSLRLLPALFGILAVPALYYVGRKLVGARAALFATLFLVFSPLHISYSQLARYWSLVFLLCAIYPYAIYVGIRDRDRGMLTLGIVTGVLAVLAHPVSILLLGGMALFVLASLRRDQWQRLWRSQAIKVAAAAAVLVIAVIVVRFVPMLYSWITEHDTNPGYGQFLLRPRSAPGLKQLFIVAAYLESLTFPLSLAAAAGAYWLSQRERSVAFYLLCVAMFPIAFLTLLSLRTSISAYYLLPSAPAFFLAAGVFFDRICDLDGRLRPRWVLPAVLSLSILASNTPLLISDYRDGRRYNFRGAANWLKDRLAPGDVVFSDQPLVLAHYLPESEVEHLRPNAAPLQESMSELQQAGQGGTLWVVAPAPSHPFRTNLQHGGLIGWIYDHCQLRRMVGVGRIDFRQQYLQVYRCPSNPPLEGEAGL